MSQEFLKRDLSLPKLPLDFVEHRPDCVQGVFHVHAAYTRQWHDTVTDGKRQVAVGKTPIAPHSSKLRSHAGLLGERRNFHRKCMLRYRSFKAKKGEVPFSHGYRRIGKTCHVKYDVVP